MSLTIAGSGTVGERRKLNTTVITLLSIVGFLLIWFVVAAILESKLLPGPVEVLRYVVNEALHGDLLPELGITLWRVAASFVVAMLIGSVIGLVMGESATLNRLLDPWVIVLLNLPALVIIILAYVWFGLNEAAAIGAATRRRCAVRQPLHAHKHPGTGA